MNSLLKNALLTVVTTLLAIGGLTAVTTVAAQAHTGNLPVTAVCNTATGQYDFTAKLVLSNVPDGKSGTSKWRIGTSTFEGTPTSFTGLDRGPFTTVGNASVTLVGTGTSDVKFSLPGTTTGHGPWFYAFTRWADANGGNVVTKGSDGQLTTALNGDCHQAPKYDASASVTVTPATCDSPEKLVLGQAVNAVWGTPTRTTGPGSYSVTATGNVGPPQHLFPAGSGVSADGKTKTFTGDLKGKDTSQNCWMKDAAASVTVSPATCDSSGTASVTGLQNAILVGSLDQSVGTHVATFTSNEGHLFSNGTDTLQVSYTVPGKDTSQSCNPPPAPKKVKGAVSKIDKCESHNYVFLKKVKGLHYVKNGKVVREGVWVRVKAKVVKIRVKADSAKYQVVGKTLFVVKFPNNSACYTPPNNPPHSGA